jgi:hypothetical protein
VHAHPIVIADCPRSLFQTQVSKEISYYIRFQERRKCTVSADIAIIGVQSVLPRNLRPDQRSASHRLEAINNPCIIWWLSPCQCERGG